MHVLAIVLLLASIVALIVTIISAVKYNSQYNTAKNTPRYKSYIAEAGQVPSLSCPDGYVISMQGDQDRSYYLAEYNDSCSACAPIDVTADVKAQGPEGKSSAKLNIVPEGPNYSKLQKLPCSSVGTCKTFMYGQYECIPA